MPYKASLSSLVSGGTHRSTSAVHLPYQHHRSGRPSDTLSFESFGKESVIASSSNHASDLRKQKSSRNLINMIKTRSRSKLRDEPSHQNRNMLQAPPLPLPPSFLPISPVKKYKAVKAKKNAGRFDPSTSTLSLDQQSSPTISEPVFRLDTNLDEMDGIVNLNRNRGMDSSSMSSGVESSHFSDHGFSSFASPPTFSDPFLPNAKIPKCQRSAPKISPNSTLPDINIVKVDEESGPSWTAPESWAVDKEGGDKQEPEYSSSDEDSSAISKRKSRRRTNTRLVTKSVLFSKPFKIRIYRANNTYHVVSIGLSVTVADLTSQLPKRLLLDTERETHRLYLKERGRERMLALTERPADIVRRRLEQAGYQIADGLDMLGTEDMRFLMTFVYKSNLLGPAVSSLSPPV
jgi:adenylate cyclase